MKLDDPHAQTTAQQRGAPKAPGSVENIQSSASSGRIRGLALMGALALSLVVWALIAALVWWLLG